MSKIRLNAQAKLDKDLFINGQNISLRVVAYFAHFHFLVFIEDVSWRTEPQRWCPLTSNRKLIDQKALIGHKKKAVKVNMLPKAPQ